MIAIPNGPTHAVLQRAGNPPFSVEYSPWAGKPGLRRNSFRIGKCGILSTSKSIQIWQIVERIPTLGFGIWGFFSTALMGLGDVQKSPIDLSVSDKHQDTQ